ncbi:MAG: LacI family DNA-binding transcriptional regulator [Terrimicrobiaceae bacterium]
MRINQAKIAGELGLSVITVSRALRNHPDLAEATKERILEKARELGYTRLRTVRAKEVTRRVGVLFYGDPDQPDPLASGVKRQIFFGLHHQCKKLDAETIIEMPSPIEVPPVVRNRTVEAVFLFGRYTMESVALLGDIPALAISSYTEDLTIPRITADNFGGMREATEHLIRLGHRKIVFLGENDPRTQIYADRARGYEWAMRQHGLDPQTVLWNLETEPAPPSLKDLKRGQALACGSDNLACSAMDYLEGLGWKLPTDCSVAAFDDMTTSSRQLTTYAPDWALMGKLAADLLLAWPGFPRRRSVAVIVPGELVVRDSAIPATA